MSARPVYLDHAATTPTRPEVIEVVAAAMRSLGNPSSLHASGRSARKGVEEAREQIAAALGADAPEVVFTSGGTEADNLAVKGIYWARRTADPRRTRVLASAIEHHAVLDTVRWLGETQGAQVEWLPVDHHGRLDTDALRRSVAADPASVALVSVMVANNEIGTLQPVGEIVGIARQHGIPVHADAVQALGQVPLDFAASGLDAMTVSGHKVGGPGGCGALLARRELGLVPVLHGGGQERDVRSGTLDAALLAGLALAIERAVAERPATSAHLTDLRDALVAGVRATVPGAVHNGHGAPQLPGIAHFSFPGTEGDSLLLLLDAAGIECSTGAACSAGVTEPSHVLLAMGVDAYTARGSLRFSLGRTSTHDDVDAVVATIGPAVERALAAGRVNLSGRR